MAKIKKERIKPKQIVSKSTFVKRITDQMKELNVYKPAFDITIDILADQLFLYDRYMREFKESGYQTSTGSAAGTAKKSPTVAMLETLWKNILQYSDRLCINPKALNADFEEKPESLLEKALNAVE